MKFAVMKFTKGKNSLYSVTNVMKIKKILHSLKVKGTFGQLFIVMILFQIATGFG